MLNSYIGILKGYKYCLRVTYPFLFVTVNRNRIVYVCENSKNGSLELVTGYYDVFRHTL